MAIVAYQKPIQLSTNAISNIITTGISMVFKDDHEKNCECNHIGLMQMSDVEFLDKVSGATLIFDAPNNQFILEPIPVIDGGGF